MSGTIARGTGTGLALAFLALALSGSGCAPWVKASEEGEAVRIVGDTQVSDCEKLGRTTSQVQDTVLGIGRSEKTMTAELASLAQNEAAKLGGDTITPITGIEAGRQTFAIYRCKR